MLEDFKWVAPTLAFVAPGYICSLVAGWFVPAKKEDEKAKLLRMFMLTMLVFVIFSLLASVVPTLKTGGTTTPGGRALYFGVIPVVLGLLLGWSAQNGAGRSIGRRLGLTILHPVDTAWDRRFLRLNEGAFVLVKMEGGDEYAARYAECSFAGDGATRDLYLETLYDVDEEGVWQPVPATEGIWIRGDKLQAIRFYTGRG